MGGDVEIFDVAAGHHEAHRLAKGDGADEALIGERVGPVLQRIGEEFEERAHRVVPLVEPARLDDAETQMPRDRQNFEPSAGGNIEPSVSSTPA